MYEKHYNHPVAQQHTHMELIISRGSVIIGSRFFSGKVFINLIQHLSKIPEAKKRKQPPGVGSEGKNESLKKSTNFEKEPG